MFRARARKLPSFPGFQNRAPSHILNGSTILRGARLKWIKLLTASCLALTCCPVLASVDSDRDAGSETPPLELTLVDAIGLALQNNRSLLDQRLDRTLQRFELEVAGDQYRPSATITPSASVERDGDPSADVSAGVGIRIPTGGEFTLRWSKPLAGQDEAPASYSLRFEQPLLRGFGVTVDTASLRIARIEETSNILSFRQAITGVVTSTIQSWRALIQANRELEIAEASLVRARDQLDVNRALIKAGQMAEREALQSESEIANRELALEEARNSLTSANFRLIDILDIDSAALIVPLETPASQRTVPSVTEGIAVALRSSPNYLQELLQTEVARIRLKLAENNRLWDLTLDTTASRVGSGGETDYAAGLNLTVPLWDRSPRLSLMNARASVQKAERGLVESRQGIGIAVRQVIHDVEVGQRRIELARRALALARQKLEIERSKLRLGLSSASQLSQFEDDLVDAQNAEVDAVISYENALTSLDQTLGTTLETWNIRVEQVE